jgi:glucose-6-phosphate 1-dehydrogenase
MLRNDVLQFLCLVAMEPPISLRDLHARKVDVLRSIHPLSPEEVVP